MGLQSSFCLYPLLLGGRPLLARQRLLLVTSLTATVTSSLLQPQLQQQGQRLLYILHTAYYVLYTTSTMTTSAPATATAAATTSTSTTPTSTSTSTPAAATTY